MLKTTFAFDFDNTITRDPLGFLVIMRMLKSMGHVVYVVTGRLRTTIPEDLNTLIDSGYRVFFTEHKAKRDYMNDLGFPVDVWVDDSPEAILEDYHGLPRTFRDMGEDECALIRN